jgi:hypothetical protein
VGRVLRGKPGRPGASGVALLVFSLQFSVPEAIGQMAGQPASYTEEIARRYAAMLIADGRSVVFAAQTDQTAYSGLVMGLAALAYRRGGVSFGGAHWEAGAGCP